MICYPSNFCLCKHRLMLSTEALKVKQSGLLYRLEFYFTTRGGPTLC